MKIKIIIFLLFLGFNCFCSNPLKTKNAKYYYNIYLELGSNGVSTQQGKKLLIKTYKSAVTEQLDTHVIYSSRLLAEVYLGELNFDSALYYGYIANEKLKSTSLIQEEVKNNINFAITYGILREYDSAFIYFQKTEDLYVLANGEIKKEILIWNRIKKLKILFYMKQYKESLVLLDQINQFCEQNNISAFDSEVNSLYSKIFFKLNKIDRAIYYQKKSLNLSVENDSLNLANEYLSIANLFSHQNRDSSIFYYKKGINHFEYINSNYMLNYACITFINSCNLSKSESDFFLSKIDTSILNGPASCFYFFAKSKAEQTNELKLIQYQKTLDCTSDISLKKDVYRELYILYKEIDSKKSLLYFELYNKLSDSINYEEQKETIENAILLNKINKKEEELYNSKKISKRILYLLIVIMLLGVVFFILTKKNNFKKQQKIIADKKSLEIEKNNIESELEEVLLISERDYDFINESKNELNKLLKKNKSDDEIKAFYTKVAHYLNVSNNEKKTNTLRVDFLNKIEKKDSLTKTEKKIVVLLRLDMSSKEISNYLSITEKSVEQYRYRIRKKLNIEKGVYLSEYFKSI